MCNHGFEFNCKQCKVDSKRIERDMVASGQWIYAVLPYTGTGEYSITNAIATYKTRSAADKRADAEYDRNPSANLVARLVRTSN